MSQENIGVVRDQYMATNERDFARAMAHFDIDVGLVVPPGFLDPGKDCQRRGYATRVEALRAAGLSE